MGNAEPTIDYMGRFKELVLEADGQKAGGDGSHKESAPEKKTEGVVPAKKSSQVLDQLNIPLGKKVSNKEGKHLKEIAPECPDVELREKIIGILTNPGAKNEPKIPALIRKRNAGLALLEWLGNHGGFVRSQYGELFYFYKTKSCLYPLLTERWAAWLYSLTGVNPAGPDYSYLMTDCKTSAMEAPIRPILRLAWWKNENQTLRVSRFDGTVYLLDGKTIEEEPNGEAVLFDDNPLWEPYTPAAEPGDPLHWLTTRIPKWESDSEMYGLALRTWIISMFFTELCPTKPLLVLIGEKGAGKSMLLRMITKILFGPYSDISGVPDKPDGFTAAAAGTHLLVLDNLDEFTEWLRDKLARISTGGMDEYRRLYTNNEVGQVRYRCWLAFTARTPDTLKRDDLADRIILLPLKRIEENWIVERNFLDKAKEQRNIWWGKLLDTLNKVVASIRNAKLESTSDLRLADWESLGRVVARVEGKEDLWNTFIEGVKLSQKAFLIEGDLVAEGIHLWMENQQNHGKEILTRELYSALGKLLFEDKSKPRDWPKSTQSFGRRLKSIIPSLRDYYKIKLYTGRGRTVFYTFSGKD